MSKTTSIMFVGVGGQGTLLASRIAGHVLLEKGFDVKVSEIHGMSQRGGSVNTYVKFGEKVWSPVIDAGEADFIVGFELMESARWLSYLKKSGKMLVNTAKLPPMPVITGTADYNDDIVGKIESVGVKTVSLDALDLAVKAGSPRSVNVVMMGVLSKQFDFDESLWRDAIRACSPPKALEINIKAFKLGQGVE